MTAAASAPWPLRLGDRALELWRRLPALVRWAGVAAGMALLWWSSARTPQPAPYNPVWSYVGNAAHFVAFAGLAAACWLAMPAQLAVARIDTSAWLLAVGYGLVDEWHQSWIPGRHASAVDLVTDAMGAAFAVWFVRGRVARRGTPWSIGAALVACGAASAALATS